MPSPIRPEELPQALAEAQELARQRALALDLRDARLSHRLEREREASRKRARRAADLLHLEEILSESGVSQVDYVLQPKHGESERASVADSAPTAEAQSS